MDEADPCRSRGFTHPADVSLREVWLHLALLFLLFAFLLVPPTNATIVVPLSEEALIDDAVAIVLGHVTSIQGNYDQTRGIIFTNITVAIEDVLKGEIPVGEITLRQLGGSFGDLNSSVVGSPQFTLGEKALLFLRVDRDGNLRVAHLYQGKFTIARDLTSGEEFATRETPPGVNALRGVVRGTSPGPGEKETHHLRGLTDRIRNHLSNATRQPTQQPMPLTLTPGGTTGTTVGAFQENFTFMGPARWFEPDSGTPISMKINSAGESLAPSNGFDQIRQAFQAWSSVPGSSFRYQDGGFTDVAGSRYDGVNAVSFRDPDGEMDPPVNCSGILAQGGFFYRSEIRTVNGTTFWRIVDGDLVFNDGWAGCGFYENFANFAEVATHELGHVLGLGHSSDPTATMYYMAHFDGRGASLRQDDINGLIAIYPGVAVTQVTDKLAPQPIGATITFTATATGGVAPHQYKWWVYNGSTWSVGQPWGTSNTFAWTPVAPGSYQIQVWARNAGTVTDTAEGHNQLAYTVTGTALSVTSLTADKPSPQVAGTPITFTANASGGVAPYQYKWWVYNGTTWSVGQNWGTGTTFAWTPVAPGSYLLQVWARNAGTTTDTPEAYRQLDSAYTVTGTALAVTSLTADKPSPQVAGTLVTFTASASNGVAPYQYKWWIAKDGAWTVGQAWGTSNTFAWTPVAPGSYLLQVWARNSGTTADTPEAYRQLAYTVTAPPPLSVTGLTPDKPSPQPLGTGITFTTGATGGVAPYQYKWWVYNGSSWTVGRDWGASTFAWTPTAPGNYLLQVWGRNNGSTADAAEAYSQISYTVTAPPPLSVAPLTVDKPSPQPVGTAVTFTASASNGVAPYQYKWWVFNGSTWRIGRDWGTGNTYTWTPTAPGSHLIQVWARNAGTNTDTPEAYRQFDSPYTVTGTALAVTALTADVAAPQVAGTPITFTATATGGVVPYQYKWWVYNGSTWSVGQAWGTSNTFAWTPTAAGNYTIQVWARNSGTTADTAEAYGQVAYAATVLTADRSSPQPPGTSITLSALANGGLVPYQHKWWGTTGSGPHSRATT